MHNAHVVEVFDSIQDLLNELTGIFLCVEALLYDTIKEFPTRHSVFSMWIRKKKRTVRGGLKIEGKHGNLKV